MSDPRGGIEVPADPNDVPAVPGGSAVPGEVYELAVLKHFEFGHLGADLARYSARFHDLAHELAERLPRSDELDEALKGLVVAKDWAVRAALAARHR